MQQAAAQVSSAHPSSLRASADKTVSHGRLASCTRLAARYLAYADMAPC